jgi:hypothetical protein
MDGHPAVVWAPSLQDSGCIFGWAFPALKRWANKHCAYGAGSRTASTGPAFIIQ